MPRKTAAQKAAEEAAEAEERRLTEQRRLRWVATAIAAIALFAAGYATGQSNARDDAGAFGSLGLVDGEAPPLLEFPFDMDPGDVGPPDDQLDRPFPRDSQRHLECEVVERDGRLLRLVCEFDGSAPFDFQDGPGDGPADEPGFLGVGLVDTSRGVVVAEVADGSPAATAGIEIDDMIVAIDGRVVRTSDEIGDLIADLGAGTEVEVTVRRFDARVTVTVALGERPWLWASGNGQ